MFLPSNCFQQQIPAQQTDCADTRSGFFQERCTLPRKNETRKFRMITESNFFKKNQNTEVVLKCAAKHKLAWESLNIFFLRSIIRKVPFCKSKSTIRFWFQSYLCFTCSTLHTYSIFFFNLHKKDSLKWFKSQDNCFGLALLFVYKIFQQDDDNYNNNNDNNNDNESKFSNLSNWKEEAWKKSGLQRDSNPWPPRYR